GPVRLLRRPRLRRGGQGLPRLLRQPGRRPRGNEYPPPKTPRHPEGVRRREGRAVPRRRRRDARGRGAPARGALAEVLRRPRPDLLRLLCPRRDVARLRGAQARRVGAPPVGGPRGQGTPGPGGGAAADRGLTPGAPPARAAAHPAHLLPRRTCANPTPLRG